MTTKITYRALDTNDFDLVISLGNLVHGDGYLNHSNLKRWHQQGIARGINASFVAYDSPENNIANNKPPKLVGFRLTFAAQQWQQDQWSSPALWNIPNDKVAYFKCNTVDQVYRGQNIGSKLLSLSIEALKQQGAQAGVSHLWRQSPNNSAVRYFTKCGGHLIKNHQRKWQQDCEQGYECILCGYNCYCEAAEMIIYFDQKI